MGNLLGTVVEDRQPVIESINVGRPQWHESAVEFSDAKRWYSGIFKTPISTPVLLNECNLAGDEQADRVNHGGRDKAIMAYASLNYHHWLTDLNRSDLPFAAFGENFTLSGCTEADICIGDTFEVGAATIQVSQPRQPCWKQERRLSVPGLIQKMIVTSRTGWYFRVIRVGFVQTGDPLRLISRPNPDWTIEAANSVMYGRPIVPSHDVALAGCPLLSEAWVNALTKRSK